MLIDTGAGDLFGPTLGKLLANLKAAGYQPEQVDEIYITHMHADHVGGLMAGDKLAFPNATVRADKPTPTTGSARPTSTRRPAAMKGFFKGAMASLNPYVKAGKFKPFDGDTDLVPGVTRDPCRAATPPATRSTRSRARAQKLVAVGRSDARRRGAVRRSGGDDPVRHRLQGRRGRSARRPIADAAEAGLLRRRSRTCRSPASAICARDGTGYRWVPVNFSAGK